MTSPTIKIVGEVNGFLVEIWEADSRMQSTYNTEFPKWQEEVYRKHGYDPHKWYGSEVAEKMWREAMRTYTGPAATAQDYFEASESEESNEYLAFVIKKIRDTGINISSLPDTERWELMDEIANQYFGNG